MINIQKRVRWFQILMRLSLPISIFAIAYSNLYLIECCNFRIPFIKISTNFTNCYDIILCWFQCVIKLIKETMSSWKILLTSNLKYFKFIKVKNSSVITTYYRIWWYNRSTTYEWIIQRHVINRYVPWKFAEKCIMTASD